MSPAKSLAVKPGPDPDARKNALIGIGVVALLVGLVLVNFVLRGGAGKPLEVSVRGYGNAAIKARIEVRDLAGKVVAEGSSDPDTAIFMARVPAGTYIVEAGVPIKETDVGLANVIPEQVSVTVPEDAAGPTRADIRYPTIEPFLEYPGRYKIHK